jgi:hypothetical protein
MIKNKKIAIDIIFLLPDKINKLVYDLNSKIIPHEGMKHYVIDGINCFPHVSLSMGTTEEANLTEIKKKILKIAKRYLPMKIVFTGIKNRKFPSLEIKADDKLINFQKEIVKEIELDYDASKEMFVDSEISDLGISWVNEFVKNNIEKYNLHTTIGLGDISRVKDIRFPIEVEINTLAIAHLGVYDSCRKILKEIKL